MCFFICCQLIYVSIICDLIIFGFKSGEGINLKSPIQDVLKATFWVLMRRKLKILIKVVEESTSMLNFGQKMRLMNGEFFVVLIQH